MSKSIRVRTTPNGDDKYIKVELKQDFDLLEILSLKIKQKDLYQNFCSNYGVVAGRVIVNNGFGLPNVKLSIFIPIDAEDLDNSIIRQIYPYESPDKDDKNIQGIRYNLLTNQQQTFDHTPVGTFNNKNEILDNQISLEIYDKYYKFTTTTNEAGDFILFGVPVGNHILHYDVDVSDIGFLSLRPYDLVERGFSKELFLSPFKFKSDQNIDNLPQILSQNLNVLVEPFWCDDLSKGRIVGITRQDINITSVDLTPSATFFGSVFSDDEKDSINKNCSPRRKTGKLGEVITTSGTLEAIRRTIDGNIETYEIPDDAIDDNGNWALQLPMNIRKVVTDEFGNLIPSPDGTSGIATEADFRFRVSMDKTDNDKRLRQRAKFLVPNMTGNYSFGEFSAAELRTTGATFNLNVQLSTLTNGSDDLTNQYNYLEDFFTFRWKKIYTIKQFIGRYQKSKSDERRNFVGIKDILNAEGVNKFPNNRIDTNMSPLYSILCLLLGMFAYLLAIINGVINQLNGIITQLCQVKIPTEVEVQWTSCERCQVTVKCKPKDGGNSIGTNTYFLRGPCIGTDPDDADDKNCEDWAEWASYNILAYEYDTITGSAIALSSNDGFQYYCRNNTYNELFQSQPDGSGCGPIRNPGTSDDFYSTQRYVGHRSTPCTSPPPAIPCPPHVGPLFANDGASFYWNRLCDAFTDDIDYEGTKENFEPCDNTCGGDAIRIKIGTYCRCLRIILKGKCVLAPLFCKKCKHISGEGDHSCCRCAGIDNQAYGCPCVGSGSSYDGQINVNLFGDRCCCSCCIKVPLITLKCPESASFPAVAPIAIPTIFAPLVCNGTFIGPDTFCITCGNIQKPIIGQWVACKLEGLAKSLNMLKFDFYNDWVNGTLYFPLFKRKFKLKKSKRKFGQIKKDKFCDFDCNDEFQDDNIYYWRTILTNTNLYDDIPISISSFLSTQTSNTGVKFCKVIIPANTSIISKWFPGGKNSSLTFGGTSRIRNNKAISKSKKDLKISGIDSVGNDCIVTAINNNLQIIVALTTGLVLEKHNYLKAGEHAAPKYIQQENPVTGLVEQINIGGHHHQQNKCNNVFRVEKREFWKTGLDCNIVHAVDLAGGLLNDLANLVVNSGETEDAAGELDEPLDALCLSNNSPYDNCEEFGVACHDVGTKACTILCKTDCDKHYNTHKIHHGIVKYEDGILYYPSILPSDQTGYHDTDEEYKANLLYPTDITELGSSVFCDIDEAPFIINELVSTTFQVSEESEKISKKLKDDKGLVLDERSSGTINLQAYVEFGCIGANCMNPSGVVNQSQIGIELLDQEDTGVGLGACRIEFDHDEEIREYFCRRFSGFKNELLEVNYQRPGSTEFENVYNTYPEKINTGTTLYQIYIKDEDGVPSAPDYSAFDSINDGDPYIPGDRCGIKIDTSNTKYFYGLAPGTTDDFLPYFPLVNSINIHESPTTGINFGTSQTPYYFYFGIIPGKTALHKVVSKYFADKINKTTLSGLPDSRASENLHNKTNFRNNLKNPLSVLKSCLEEKIVAE
jgi:hypothetical protein